MAPAVLERTVSSETDDFAYLRRVDDSIDREALGSTSDLDAAIFNLNGFLLVIVSLV